MEDLQLTTSLGKRKGAALRFIFITIFLDLLGIGIIAPLFAFYVMQFSASALVIGLLSTSYAVMQFFSAPILGMLSDRYGRRPVLLISQFGSAIGYALFAMSHQLWLLFLSRMISGITGGNVSTAQAYIADVTPLEERSKGFAMFGAAAGLGFVLGPAIAGFTVKYSLGLPSWIAAGLSLANMVYGFFVLPESNLKRGLLKSKNLNPLASVGTYIRNSRYGFILAAIFASYLCQTALQTIFSKYAFDRFNYSYSQVAYLLTYIGILTVIFQGGLMRYIKRIPEKLLGTIALTLVIIGYLGIALASNLFWLLLALFILGLGNAGTQPVLSGRLSRLAQPSEQGAILGASQSVTSIGAIVGPIIAGAIYQLTGSGGPYIAASIYAVVALLLIRRSFQNQENPL